MITARKGEVTATLVLFMAVVPAIRADDAQSESIRALRKIGATVTQNNDASGQPVIGVEFNYNRVPGATLRLLTSFKELQTLDLSGTFMSESDLNPLLELRQLRTLRLRHATLSRTGFKILARLDRLETLDLRQSCLLRGVDTKTAGPPERPAAPGKRNAQELANFVGSGLTYLNELAALPKLHSLALGATQFKEENLKNLTGLRQLRSLSLESNYATFGSGLRQLAALPELRSVDLSYNWLTEAGTKVLGGLRSLETLVLQNTTPASDRGPVPRRPWPDGLADLAGLMNLRTLDLRGNPGVTDEGMSALAPLTRLETLNLQQTGVTDAGLPRLRALQSLQTLNLLGTKVGDSGALELANFRQLRALNLSYTRMTDAGIRSLAALRQLRSLELNQLPLTDAGLQELTALQRLEKLTLNGPAVSGTGLKKLGAVPPAPRIGHHRDKSHGRGPNGDRPPH